MANYNPTTGAGRNRPLPEPAPEPELEDDDIESAGEQRVAITLSVGDGFKFGCGMLLAGVAFYFALIIVAATALLFATILGLPLPFGLGH